MQLQSFTAQNFRCLSGEYSIAIHPLTVFIGENDAGKSATLDALDIFFDRKRMPAPNDFMLSGPAADNQPLSASKIVLTAVFKIDQATADSLVAANITVTTIFSVRKTYTLGQAPTVDFLGPTPVDPALRIDVLGMTLPQIRQFAQEHNVSLPGGIRKEPNAQALETWVKAQPHTTDWSPAPQALLTMLPSYELVRDTKNPENIVHQFLKRVFQTALEGKKYSSRIQRLKNALDRDLRKQAVTLVEPIRRYVPEVENVIVEPVFSFENALRETTLQIVGKDGNSIDLSMRGAGLRQKVTMGVYEWSSDVFDIRKGETERPFILALDEPDIHLDYKSQQYLYNVMLELSEHSIQVVIATHSINFVNRVPINHINHYSLNTQGNTQIDRLAVEDPDEREIFLSDLGKSMGLENATLFYERAFLAFEGKTEEGALPRLFEIYFNETTHARGVKLVNAYDNYGAIVFAKFMNKNNRAVVFMVDEDTTTNKGTKRIITSQSLEAAGFPRNQMFIVEPSCFELAFSNEVWARVLNKYQCTQENKEPLVWTPDDVENFRPDPKVFIDQICKVLAQESKPIIGSWLSKEILNSTEIPASIRECFEKVNKLANPQVVE